MKKTILVVALMSTMISCKKETTTPTTSGNTNTTVDTTSQTGTSPLINSLDCSSAVITGTLKKGVEANAVSVKLNYTGGNGKVYTAQTISSTTVTGLTAKLSAGILATGAGSVTYLITGTPSATGTANFAINLGGKSCIFSIEVLVPTGSYGQTITDVDGNIYKTVYIGKQQWMAENLKTSKYSDGTDIPNIIVTNKDQWINLTTGAWVYYNNDITKNVNYGKLYNWYALNPITNGNKNVCPNGWHVPSDTEWTVLTDYLGGAMIDTTVGGQMKEVGNTNWNSPNIGATNTSLFTGRAGGMLDYRGRYVLLGEFGLWWSSTEHNKLKDYAWRRSLDFDNGGVYFGGQDKNDGLSIRCLKDQ
jgi:uncharacterized protein (TIGR02145 family)